jgi:hypothetical protein
MATIPEDSISFNFHTVRVTLSPDKEKIQATLEVSAPNRERELIDFLRSKDLKKAAAWFSVQQGKLPLAGANPAQGKIPAGAAPSKPGGSRSHKAKK